MAQSWSHSWGGNSSDWGTAVAPDSSGNVYVVGATYSFGAGASDVLLLKYDVKGNLVWARTWGGTDFDGGAAIAVDAANNVYVAGGTGSFGAGSGDALLLKFSSAGSLLWTRTWGGGNPDAAYDISLDAQGNIYLAGTTGGATVLLKFSNSGAFLSSRTWTGVEGYSDDYTARSIDIDGSGNIILAGADNVTNADGSKNTYIVLLKYDSQETLLWSHILRTADLGGFGHFTETDGPKSVRADSTGNIYVSGDTSNLCPPENTNCSFSDYDSLLVKLDPNGNQIWATTWGGSNWDYSGGMAFDANGNPVVAGTTLSFGHNEQAMVLQYDINGNLGHSRTWGGSGTSFAAAIILDQSDGVYIVGDAFDNTGNWQDVTGTTAFLTVSIDSPPGTNGSPAGVVGSPSGVVGTPIGLIDTASGNCGDVLNPSPCYKVLVVHPSKLDTQGPVF